MKYLKELTLIIITFKSDKIIYDFIKKIPKKFKVIVVENSKNFILKKKLEKKHKNVTVYLRNNEGVSRSLNYGVKKTNTKYFIHISPDLSVNYDEIKIFFKYAFKLNDNFCALGPRFINTKKKGHLQINKKLEFGKIESIHGSFMFINKKRFDEIGGWDKNIFLYFEETDFCFRAKKMNLYSYQINSIKTQTIDTTVQIDDINKKQEWLNLLTWHFIWSKFYFYKKHYNIILAILYFIPIILRTTFKIVFYSIFNNQLKKRHYLVRLDGLIRSIIGLSSNKRLKK